MSKEYKKSVDLFLFMGQSNMAGRGVSSSKWPETVSDLTEGAGYEFRAISDPTKLYKIEEPFGFYEDKVEGMDDHRKKTGSMVTSFVNAYYRYANTPIVGIAASVGGTSIAKWQPGTPFLIDVEERLNLAIHYLESNNYIIRHKYMLWCQGESDGDIARSKSDYKQYFETMLGDLINKGIEKCFLVRIGNYNGNEDKSYSHIIDVQTEIAQTNNHVVMVSTDFAAMKDRGLMKDAFHYYQQAYNEVGTKAGINAAYYVNNGKEPVMYDPQYDNLYYSRKG